MAKSVLLSKFRTEIRRRNLSYRTEQIYIGWITRYIHYHNLTHPTKLNEADVVKFLNYLVIKRGAALSIQNQAEKALHFFYNYVMHKPLNDLQGIVQGDTPYISGSVCRKKQIRAS